MTLWHFFHCTNQLETCPSGRLHKSDSKCENAQSQYVCLLSHMPCSAIGIVTSSGCCLSLPACDMSAALLYGDFQFAEFQLRVSHLFPLLEWPCSGSAADTPSPRVVGEATRSSQYYSNTTAKTCAILRSGWQKSSMLKFLFHLQLMAIIDQIISIKRK